MDFYANEGKAVTIQANGKTYARHAITTHFVQVARIISTSWRDMSYQSTNREIFFPPAKKSLPYAKGG